MHSCGTCGKRYKYMKNLKRHLQYECGVERQFQCVYCKYIGRHKGHLISHTIRKHNNQVCLL